MINLKLVGILLFSLFGLPFSSFAAEAVDVRSLSLGKIRALSDYVIPASAFEGEQKRLGFSLSNHFQLSELTTFSAYSLLPVKSVQTGLRIYYFGFEDYSQCSTQLALAQRLSDNWYAGVALFYQYTSGVYEDRSEHYITAHLALSYKASEAVWFSFLLENCIENAFSETRRYSLGAQWVVTQQARAFAEFGFDGKDYKRLSLGIEYELISSFYLRAGAYTQTGSPTFGLSFRWDNWSADLACDRHSLLGYNTSLGVNYTF